LRLTHGGDGLDVVAGMARVLQNALRTGGHLAQHAVEAEGLFGVFGAARRSVERRRRPRWAALGRAAHVHQRVLGEGAARRVAALAARVAVPHVALFALDRSLARRLLGAQLARHALRELELQTLRIAVFLHDVEHRPVFGQVVGAVLVKVHHLGTQTRQYLSWEFLHS